MTKDITFPEHITSLKNPRIKKILGLQKHKERKTKNLFLTEGLKELSMAIKSGYKIQEVYYCPEIISFESLNKILWEQISTCELISVSTKVFEKIAYRENTGGVLCILHSKLHELHNIKINDNSLFLILESVEKPGNLGAILRTADAAAVDAIIVCDPKTDLYNPNVIRSSIGCIFSVPIAISDSHQVIDWLKNNGFKIYCSALTASMTHYNCDFTGKTAIIMGAEANGLSKLWLDSSTQNIIIPMQGKADSMNVSTSAAVLIYEAIRQRLYPSLKNNT